ncbi:MAG: hypothetical protein LR015_02535 [Verrucomicrobia bacterium]|nr:hypothetical protein [Verrucomicrobiota bacterium]
MILSSFTLGSVLAANTPLLTNTDFVGTEPWIAGSNLFTGTNWTAFVGSTDGRYTVESRIQRSGNSVIFSAYDDGVSDIIESYLFQEFPAGLRLVHGQPVSPQVMSLFSMVQRARLRLVPILLSGRLLKPLVTMKWVGSSRPRRSTVILRH